MEKIFLILLLLSVPVVVEAETQTERLYRFYYIFKEYSSTFYEEGQNDPAYLILSNNWVYDSEVSENYDKPKEVPISKTVEKVVMKDVENGKDNSPLRYFVSLLVLPFLRKLSLFKR